MADDKTPEQLKAAAAAAQNLQNELKRVLELKKALSDAKAGGVVANALQEELKLAQDHTKELGKHKDLNEGAAKEALKTAKHDLARAEAAERTSKAREAEAKQYEKINATLGKAKGALNDQLGMWTSIDGIAAHLLESVVKLDGTLKGLGKDTGLVGQFDNAMMGAWESSAGLGATMEDARAGMGALASTLPRLTSLSDAQQQALGAQAVAFEKAGIGAQGFANISNVMMETLGKSAGETVAFSDSLVSLSKEIGVSAKKMTSDFESVKETVAEFGDSGGEVFESLAKQSRALGVDMKTLVKVAEGFDTFEDAASRVGKLNAQMGLNLNAVAMMNEQDPTKRIQMIRDQFQMTGKSFETMSRLEKKAVADMMGMDVSMAARMLGTEDEFSQAVEGQKTAAEMAKELQTMGERLAAIGQQLLTTVLPVLKMGLTVIEGIMWAMGKVGEGIDYLNKAWGSWVGGLITGLALLGSIVVGFKLIKGTLSGLGGKLGEVFGKAGGGVGKGGIGGKLKSLGRGLKGMAGKDVLFGALNLIPAGIGLLAATPGMLAFGLAGLMAPLVVAGLTGLATGLSVLGQAKGALMGIGILALLGLALLPFAYAMSLMAGVSWETIGSMTLGILAITAMAAGLTFAAPFIAIGALALAGLGGALLVLAEGLLAVNSAASGLSDVQALIKASVKIDSGSIENLEKLVDQVVRVTTEANTKEDTVDKILQALGLGKTDKEKTANTQKTIKLMLNERELGEVVTDLINERYDLATA